MRIPDPIVLVLAAVGFASIVAQLLPAAEAQSALAGPPLGNQAALTDSSSGTVRSGVYELRQTNVDETVFMLPANRAFVLQHLWSIQGVGTGQSGDVEMKILRAGQPQSVKFTRIHWTAGNNPAGDWNSSGLRFEPGDALIINGDGNCNLGWSGHLILP